MTGEKLFVGNLPSDATEVEIELLFAPFGEILEVHLLGSARSRSGHSCAFVRFADHKAAAEAVTNLNGNSRLRSTDPEDNTLTVRFARDKIQTYCPQTSNAVCKRSASAMSISESEVNHKLFIGLLPNGTTVREVNFLFRQAGIQIIESLTCINTRSVGDSNSVSSAFAFLYNSQDCLKAIQVLDERASIRNQRVRVRQSIDVYSKKQRSLSSNSTSLGSTALSAYHEASLTTLHPLLAFDQSVPTYVSYLSLPQSKSYGPLDITPGREPWISQGLYPIA